MKHGYSMSLKSVFSFIQGFIYNMSGIFASMECSCSATNDCSYILIPI